MATASSTAMNRVALFDHLVGAGEQCSGHCETKRFRSLEVDDQFILGWILHRQIGWSFALEDTIDVGGGPPIRVDQIGAVGDQTAARRVVAEGIDRYQPPSC